MILLVRMVRESRRGSTDEGGLMKEGWRGRAGEGGLLREGWRGRPGEVAQWVSALAAKPEHLSSVPET